MTTKIPLLVVAGEVSGDQLGSSILEKFKNRDQYHIFGCGGAGMQKMGTEILYDIKDMEVIGISEVVSKYFRLRSYLNELTRQALSRKVKDAILIDYPGFNLALARKLTQLGIRCHMVVSPQIWAWNYSRIKKIKKYIKNMLCLYHFEVDIYKKHDVPAYFMGHPLAEQIRVKSLELKKQQKTSGTMKKPMSKRGELISICLLPGSRRQEIEKMLPFMLKLINQFSRLEMNNQSKYTNFQFLLPCPADDEIIKKINSYIDIYNEDKQTIKLMPGKAHEALSISHAAIACSGTVTLECLLWRVPFLLFYSTSWSTYFIGRLLVRIPYIGIVNVMASEFVHQEFIQGRVTMENVMPEFKKIVSHDDYRRSMLNKFEDIHKKMYQGDPAKRAAEFLKNVFTAH